MVLLMAAVVVRVVVQLPVRAAVRAAPVLPVAALVAVAAHATVTGGDQTFRCVVTPIPVGAGKTAKAVLEAPPAIARVSGAAA